MKKKTLFITLGIIVAVIVFIGGLFATTNNKAITYEEQISSAKSSIEVQEKRRVDLVYNLADTVKSYNKYESSTLKDVVDARGNANSTNIEDTKLAINAVAEAYPELKANQNYKQLMTELSMTENLIAEYRENYNLQVRSYNKFIRKFPNNIVLNIMGYEKVNTKYSEFNAPEDAPQNLLGDE